MKNKQRQKNWMLALGSVVGFGLGASGHALAQQSESAYFEELPIVLTASRLEQPLSESPNTVTVIDRKMIEASGFRTIPDVLRLVPGMYVGLASASQPIVSLNSSGDPYARRMQVQVDGRSVFLAPMGDVSWLNLDVLFDDVERIEVVQGPASASYGSNAFFGVINIITYGADLRPDNAVYARLGAASDASARFTRTGEQLDYGISFGTRGDNGIDTGILDDYSRTDIYSLHAKLRLGGRDALKLVLSGSDSTYGMGVVDRPENAFRENSSNRTTQSLRWEHVWANGDDSRLDLTHIEQTQIDPYICINSDVCQSYKGVDPSTGFVSTTNFSQRNDLNFQTTNILSKTNRVVWGGGVRTDSASAPLLLSAPSTVSSWNVFAHDEWRLTPKALANLGAMVEDDGFGNTAFTPRAALNYHLDSLQTVRLSYSTATRSPVMGEEFIAANNTTLGGSYVPPMTPLTPETIQSFEVGYLGEFLSRRLSLDLRLYQEQVHDLITVDKYANFQPGANIKDPPVQSADSFKNMFANTYNGFNATVKYNWDEGHSFVLASYTWQQLTAAFDHYPNQYYSTVGYANTTVGTIIQNIYQVNILDQVEQFVPQNMFNVLVSESLPNDWRLNGGYYYRDMVREGYDVAPNVTPESAMRRLDLGLSKTWKYELGRTLVVSAVVQNASRDGYTKFGTINAVAEVNYERRGWLAASYRF